MFAMRDRIRVAAGMALGLASLLVQAQSDAPNRSVSKRAAVEYIYPEQVTVSAGKAATVALHFKIAQGLHINSHTPREKELIPTRSEERRVGKECRSRWSPHHSK